MVVKAAATETGAAFTLVETAANPPDAGPPLHLHRHVDEAFYVLEGTYEFYCGSDRIEAGPGGFVLLPRGVPHRYRTGADGGRALMFFSPGGTEGYFREIALAMSSGTGEHTLAELAHHHGIDLLDDY
jgi:mannose-6-phosphate isomerase-like protein (cupin superfamily)